MNSCKISIIIPVFNVESYIEECLNSVLSQTLTDFEVICLNDASEDDSLSILKRFQNKDRRVKVIDAEKSGQGVLRNKGIELAKGEFIGFVDGDDTLNDFMFEKLYNAAVDSASDIAFCHAKCIDASGKRIKFPYYDKERKCFKNSARITTFTNQEIVEKLDALTAVCWNKIYKRSFLSQHKIRFASGIIHEDLPFFFKAMLNAEKATLVRESLYLYTAVRTGSTSQSAMSMTPRMISVFKIIEIEIADKLKDPFIREKYSAYKITQVLSFLSYAFNRFELKYHTKLRYFVMVRNVFIEMGNVNLRSVDFVDRFHYKCVKKGNLKLFKTRPMAEALRYHMQDLKKFRQLLQLLIEPPKRILVRFYSKIVKFNI